MQHSVSTAPDHNCSHGEIEMLNQEIYNHLLDEITLGVCFEVHRASKLGFLFLDETSIEEDQKYSIVDEKGYDIFGQATVQLKKQYECICPNCQRSLAAQRFAPHLEKCMGMGRNSSRIASKRIANATGKSGGGESDAEDCDNSADTDWNYSCDTKKSKRKKEKPSNSSGNPFLKKSIKTNSRSNFSNGLSSSISSSSDAHLLGGAGATSADASNSLTGSSSGSSSSAPTSLTASATTSSTTSGSNSSNNCLQNYENMSLPDKKMMLSQICGVISEHTKKMCTRTLRCPQHTDEQRKHIRLQMLTSMSTTHASAPLNTGPAQETNHGNSASTTDDGDSIHDSMYRLWSNNLDSLDSYPSDSSSSNLSSKRKQDTKLIVTRAGGSKRSKSIKKGQQSNSNNNNQLGNSVHLGANLHADTSHYIV